LILNLSIVWPQIMIMLDEKMSIFHFTGKCIISIHQKKYNSISEYNTFIEILNNAMMIFLTKKKKQQKKQQNTTYTSTKKKLHAIYIYLGDLVLHFHHFINKDLSSNRSLYPHGCEFSLKLCRHLS
jgi:hypothetical protein